MDWRKEYADQRVADTSHGTYRVGDADSIDRREVTITNEHGEYFIGRVLLIDDGIQMAEKHADWVSVFTPMERS